MAVDHSLTSEQFSDGVRRNGFIVKGNPFYNNDSSGYSPCITGRPTRAGANVLCNCTGLAAGAFNESYIKHKYGMNSSKWPSNKFPYRLRNQANYFLDGIRIQYYRKYKPSEFNKNILDFPELFTSLDASTSLTNWGDSSVADLYKYIIPASGIPPEGGIIVWKDMHVAYIAKVNNNDSITIVQSGYDYGPWTEANNAGTGWCNDTRTITRNQGGTNLWYYHADQADRGCLGFIANPAVTGDIPDTPDPPTPPEPEVTKYGVHIGGKFYSAHIYNGTKWVKATPKIYNGTKWVNCSE